MSLNNYVYLNKRLNATEKKFKESWRVITEKFAAIKNGTSNDFPTAEEIAKSKKAWNELLEISQAMNNLHLR
jgi:hypothetical protein